MAIYTHNGLGGSPATPWYNVDIDGDNPSNSTGILFVLPNSDGTFTLIRGNGFVYDGITGEPTGGTVTSIDRANNVAGTTVYETVTGLNLSLVTLTSTDGEGNREAFALIFTGADTFTGHNGDDLFVGGPGGDSFLGSTGVDTVSYDNALAAVSANLLNAAGNTGDAAGDNYNNSIENLIGSDFDDSLFGNGADNIIRAGLGNNSLAGGATMGGLSGNDTLDGGAGSDIVNYTSTNITAAITVVMDTTSTVTGNSTVGTDTLINVERIRGTQFNDSFTATLNFSGSNGTNVEFEGNDGDDTIVGNGTTRIGYSQAAAGVTVNLLAGTAQSIAGGDAAGIGVDSFAGTIGPNNINRVVAVRGSAFDDIISAAGARGTFDFIGGAGNDTFIGTTEGINNFDNNEARYDIGAAVPNAITVVLDSNSTVLGGAAFGTDTLINVERVRGTNLNDTFTANAGFSGQYGTQNNFEGMGGNDTITGNGHTFIRYGNASAAVTVNLQTGTAHSSAGGDAAAVGTDTIIGGVNQVAGSNFDDTLTGNNGAQAESFFGGQGNDTINGGGGILDRVGYRGDPSGIVANLTTGFVTDGYGDTDTLINIEGVGGSEFNDVITGDGNTNRLGGQNGDDQLFGLGGDDFLSGDDGIELYANAFGGGGVDFDSGNDLLDGGTGADQMWGGKGNDIYVVDDVGDVVTEFASEGADTVQTTLAIYNLGADVENLTYIGTDFILGSGNALANVLNAASATNTVRLEGLGGADQLTGGSGSDLLYIDSLDTVVQGGAGFDTAIVQGTDGVSLNLATSNVEAVIGGIGNDIFNASSAAGTVSLTGLGGADQLTGGSGSDLLYFDSLDTVVQGGAGVDFALVYFSETAGVNLDLAASNVEFAYGAAGNDIFDASDATGTVFLYGAAGADQLTGGSGSDIIHFDNLDTVVQGGAGVDFAVVDFASTAGVTLNLAAAGIEFAYGGVGNDTFNASAATSTVQLFGLGGTDQLTGGSGDDVLWFDSFDTVVQGGAGVNSAVVWFTETNGVTLNMTAADIEVAYGGQGNDVLTATGTTENTRIVGLGGADQLTGGSADDAIFGGDGDDQIFASAGNDYLQGDAGSDTVNYNGDSTDYTITNIGGGFYFVTGAGIGTHTLFQVETVHFNNTDIIL